MRRETADISGKDHKKGLTIVRGGGDLATGTIHRLWAAGFPVLVLERADPAAIRRQVSVCEAIYEGEALIEGMRAVRIDRWEQAWPVIEADEIPVLADPKGGCIEKLKPMAVVDAILAKKNLGTKRDMAPLTIGLGPGFEAGVDTDHVIETKRGHDLGRIIRCGRAYPDTKIPGDIGGFTKERVLYAERAGTFQNIAKIGDLVEPGETVAQILGEDGKIHPVAAPIGGILRGLLRDGYTVTRGFKIADIDPRRGERENCFKISDKARCIAGSVLELCAAFSHGQVRGSDDGKTDHETHHLSGGRQQPTVRVE